MVVMKFHIPGTCRVERSKVKVVRPDKAVA